MKLQEFLKINGVPFKSEGEHRHTTRGRVNVDCPFCSPGSNRFRLGINLKFGYASCWTCGYHKVRDVLETLLNLSAKESFSILKQMDWIKQVEEVPKTRGKLKIPDGVGELLKPHKEYLRKRGLDPDKITTLWKVGGIGVDSIKHRWSLFIPIHSQGRVVSWTTRSIANKKPKYINASSEEEERSAKTVLYGEDFVRNSIVIVEGPIDAWTIGPGAVATMGLNYTRAQFNRMIKYPLRCVCFDSDNSAEEASDRLSRELSQYPGETYRIVLETGKDPNEASQEEIEDLRKRFLE